MSRVTFRFIPEFSARLAALLAGEIDIIKDVPSHTVEMLDKSGKAKGRSTVSSRIKYLALVNLKPGPMQVVRVRKAIEHAVDVDELIQQVLQGRATKCADRSRRSTWTTPPTQCMKYDPAQAQALFKEAGIDPTNLQLTLDTPSGGYPLDKDVRSPSPPSSSGSASGQRGGERVGHDRQDQEPDDGRHVLPRLGAGAERPEHHRTALPGDSDVLVRRQQQAIDAKIAQAVTIVDPKKRLEAWAELQQMVHDEAPWVFLWQQHDLDGVANWIEWTPARREGLVVRSQGRSPVRSAHGHHRSHQRVPDRLHGQEPVDGATVIIEASASRTRSAPGKVGPLKGNVETLDLKGRR